VACRSAPGRLGTRSSPSAFVVLGLLDLVAPVEAAAAAGLFRRSSDAREARRFARWQRHERQRLLHELTGDENDRYFLTS
jgi:hypothetical protein